MDKEDVEKDRKEEKNDEMQKVKEKVEEEEELLRGQSLTVWMRGGGGEGVSVDVKLQPTIRFM